MTFRSEPPAGTSGRLAIATIILVLLFVVISYRSFQDLPPIRVQPGKLLINPYLQLGKTGRLADIEVCWGSAEPGAKWTLSSSIAPGLWLPSPPPVADVIQIEGIPRFSLLHAPIGAVTPGVPFAYRIEQNGKVVFQTEVDAFPDGTKPYRFIVTGDTAKGTLGERKIVNAMYQANPDLVMIAGDIVYAHGRLQEYFGRYFPIYNADHATEIGSPLLRSTLVVAAPGNHDTAVGASQDTRNLDAYPDGLAYFELWRQPLNGPALAVGGHDTPIARGSREHRNAFLHAAAYGYPRMTNFSFDFANAHWTVLDGNAYVDWTEPRLRQWVEQDIRNAFHTKWHFVIFHQPGFNSDTHHGSEQRMRLLSDIFQRSGVDVVFQGHVHNYQRSRPLFFTPRPGADGKLLQKDGTVGGDFKIDSSFDGNKVTKPNGVIYIITGCGGAELTGANLAAQPEKWKPFTAEFTSKYSYTLCDMNDKTLQIQQLTPEGKVLDKFTITK